MDNVACKMGWQGNKVGQSLLGHTRTESYQVVLSKDESNLTPETNGIYVNYKTSIKKVML